MPVILFLMKLCQRLRHSLGVTGEEVAVNRMDNLHSKIINAAETVFLCHKTEHAYTYKGKESGVMAKQ